MYPERNQRLTEFIVWVATYIKGDEKGEAQTYLDRLLNAFGHKGLLESGGEPERRIRREKEGKTTVSFADFVLNGTVLIEMKKRGEKLEDHYYQLESYWMDLSRKPRYAILCNFDELWIYDFPTQFKIPVDKVALHAIVERQSALEFLFKGSNLTPVFQDNLIDVTKKAAASLAVVFRSLIKRVSGGYERSAAQRYILQCIIALFSEDIGLLPPSIFTRLIENCLADFDKDPSEAYYNSVDQIGLLFRIMNDNQPRRGGSFYEVSYFNGGIFRVIDPLPLTRNELQWLRDATRENWSRIKPEIFGTVFEQSLSSEERHKIGAHFTSEQDIKRIVDPVIVKPWDARIDEAESIVALQKLHEELCNYIVLDPACGSGNFLYVAYIELKSVEKRLLSKIERLGDKYLPQQLVSVKQFYGYDVNSFAVELAKVTLMIAKKIAADTLHSNEPPLPLDNLDANIRCEDALFADWVEFDACIGNPPYLGSKQLKQEHPPEYINRVRDIFPDISGNADYCVYWFRKAHDLMKSDARVGLMGTQSIRKTNSRKGGLDHILHHGGIIYEAIPTMPWSGDAKVHVSIVCWSKGQAPQQPRLWLKTNQLGVPLVGTLVDSINSSLSSQQSVGTAHILSCNTHPKRVFQGQTPGHKGFILSYEDAEKMVKADSSSRDIIFSYLTGDDLVGNILSQPSRLVIDFEGRDIVTSRTYRTAFKHVQTVVLPDVETKAKEEQAKNEKTLASNPRGKVNKDHQMALENWWLHFRERSDRRKALQGITRYIACSRVSARPIFEFVSTKIKPADGLQTFLFEDDYTFGILQSRFHWEWWQRSESRFKDDPSYTPSNIFDRFPFPQQPSVEQIKAVASAAKSLQEYRRQQLTETYQKYDEGKISRAGVITLRELYKLLEVSGNNPLRNLHDALDKAVIRAYGFDATKDILEQLLSLNEDVASRIQQAMDVTSPGIPLYYTTPTDLVSDGCIQLLAL